MLFYIIKVIKKDRRFLERGRKVNEKNPCGWIGISCRLISTQISVVRREGSEDATRDARGGWWGAPHNG